ncbi:Plexin-C1 [Liparis tanakae]|uniref:Plexin-C1 n=1 Tax=Liparis tanakae TaxID=230148 RepID=A0A4Z2GMZ5_9TELE|nr:Plexin-C1 [Liparis tanakae]
MILLPGLLLVLWGEPGRCLEEKEENGGFTFDGDIRHFAVAGDAVFVATEERLYQLSHDLTLIQSLTQRGVFTAGHQTQEAVFTRVPETEERNATLRVNVLLPLVADRSLVSCGVIECGYCEVLDLRNISHVRYREHILVGSPWSSSASVAFLVDVEQRKTETYILTATQHELPRSSCFFAREAVKLHNSNEGQGGSIFSLIGEFTTSSIQRIKGSAEFVDGFQIDLNIYLFANLPAGDNSNNRVRLIWLEGKTNKKETLQSLRGATLRVSGGGARSRLVASAVVPGGPPVLWSGVFSVDGGRTDTRLLLFDISPDLSVAADADPDFCSACPPAGGRGAPGGPTLQPTAVLLKQSFMTSVLAVRQKAWMVFFIGTGDGQLIKLAVDQNYRALCPRVLYRADGDRQVFPRMLLDQVDLKHVYLPLQNQMKRVPVSRCSSHASVQACWSAQDPFCVWCGSRRSCTFEDDCQDSDWISVPEDSQPKMVSYKVVKDGGGGGVGRLTLVIQTHLTVGREARANFSCQFTSSSSELCSPQSPPAQFPQCTCVLSNGTLPAEGRTVTLTLRLGSTELSEQLHLSGCSDIRGPPTSVLCRRCVAAGCGWSQNACSWAAAGPEEGDVCRMESGMNFSRPEISSIAPSVVSFYGRNHAVLSGYNLGAVTGVRIRADTDCAPRESPVWNNVGVELTFHIPGADNKGAVSVCVLLPDGSCHGNATITYQSAPSCTDVVPSCSWISGNRENLTYDTPAADRNTGSSSVFLKVANETLACSTAMTYYPDPEFTSFTSTRTGDGVRITLQKKADRLQMSPAEVSVWGVEEGRSYPCIMEAKESSNETDFFICEIQQTPNAKFQHLRVNIPVQEREMKY